MIAGSSNYSLICTVTVDDGTPSIKWFDSDGNEVIHTTETLLVLTGDELSSTLRLQFTTLQYHHAGEYSCEASLALSIGTLNSSQSRVITVESKH